MRHGFKQGQIGADHKWVQEVCECGVVSRRYRKGYRMYRQPDGSFSLKSVGPCPGRTRMKRAAEEETMPDPMEVNEQELPEPKPEKPDRLGGVRIPPGSIFDIPKDRRSKRILERTSSPSGELGWPPGMTEEQKAAETERVRLLMEPHEKRYQADKASGAVEAQLKDAYIIINLLYQEAVEAGRMTAGRIMAGRLLYSIGYHERVKQLENQ